MKRSLLLIVTILLGMHLQGQFVLTGVVSDEHGQPLPGANLYFPDLKRGTITYNDGSFSMNRLPGGRHVLTITFVGYEAFSDSVELASDLHAGRIVLTRSAIVGEEVTITATRAGARTPVAYSNLDREEISARNFGQDVPYLLSATPSLVTSSDAGHGIGYTSLRIRGTDANRINVTINGIPLNDAESHAVYWVDLPDIATSTDHIQIQRGVGTSTNGAAAFGASINLQTNTIRKEPYALYEGTLGSFRTLRNAVSAGTGLLGGHVAVDLRLSDLHSDGFIDRSWTKLQSYYFSAGYHGAKTLLKYITFSGKEELYQAWNGVPSYLLDSHRTYNELGAYTDAGGQTAYYDNQIDHYVQVHHQLHFSRVISESVFATAALHYTGGKGYYEQYREGEELAGYRLEAVIAGGDTITETDLIRRKWLDNDFYGMVGSLHYRAGRFTTVMGGGWNRYDGEHFGTVIWSSYAGESRIRYRWYENTGIKSDWNGYLKSTYSAGEKISLFADLQLRGIDYSIEGFDDDLRDISQEHAYLFFNPKAGLNLQMEGGGRAYLFVARANREPNRSNFVDADPSGPVPVQETLIDYEAGFSLLRPGAEVGINLYFMDYTDQLVLTGEINDVGSPVMTNVRDSYRAGVELSATFRPAPWLDWDLNTTFSTNKILNYTGYVDNWDYWSDPEVQPYQIREERGTTDLSFSPPVILNSRLEFRPIPQLQLQLLSRYVGRQFIDNTSSTERMLDPYFVSDLKITSTFHPAFLKELSLQFQVSNLFNAQYETNAWIYRYYLEGEEGRYDGFFPQAGLHAMAGVRLKF